MRHLGSVVFAPLAALVALVLIGRGLLGLAEATAVRPVDYLGVAMAGAAVGMAGLAVALLTMARFSPLGPALAGAGYLAVGIWALADSAALPTAVAGLPSVVSEEQVAAATPVALLLGFPLLVTLFIPRRWRGRDLPEPAPGGNTYGRRSRLSTHTLDDIPPVPAAPPPSPAPARAPAPAPAWPAAPSPARAWPAAPSPGDETTISLPPGTPPIR